MRMRRYLSVSQQLLEILLGTFRYRRGPWALARNLFTRTINQQQGGGGRFEEKLRWLIAGPLELPKVNRRMLCLSLSVNLFTNFPVAMSKKCCYDKDIRINVKEQRLRHSQRQKSCHWVGIRIGCTRIIIRSTKLRRRRGAPTQKGTINGNKSRISNNKLFICSLFLFLL